MYVKSSFCKWDEPACGEIAGLDGERIYVRDSERPTEVAWFTREAWQRIVDAIKAGEFDLQPYENGVRDSQMEQVG
jgi:hypothetical protein